MSNAIPPDKIWLHAAILSGLSIAAARLGLSASAVEILDGLDKAIQSTASTRLHLVPWQTQRKDIICPGDHSSCEDVELFRE